MRKKHLLSLCLALFVVVLSYAQTMVVTGRVSDQSGNPVQGASVLIKGTASGTSTDAGGNYKISVKKGDKLVFTALNFEKFEALVSSNNVIPVTLATSNLQMDEVIVTAAGVKSRKKELGTSSTTVKSDNLVAGKAVNIASGLQGKVAGLQISATDGGVNPSFRMVLRGQRSLTGNNQALLVLDNVIVPNDVLGNLNPQDVDEVTVLNGAGAAALYGSQASNGAIIVTTKKGKKGASKVNVSNTTSFQNIAFFPKFQTKFGAGGSGYGYDVNGKPIFSYLENQSYGPAYDGIKRALGPALEDGSQDSAYYSNNPNARTSFWQTGVTNQSDVSLESGDENSTFRMSAQYLKTTGTTPGDKYNRTSLRVGGNRKIREGVTATYTVAYVQNRYDLTSRTGNMYDNMLNMPSNVDITKYKNWRTDKFANPNGFYNPWYENPYFTADNYRSVFKNDYLIGNVELKITPIKGLDFIARQGFSGRYYTSKSTQGAFNYTEFAKHTDGSSKSDIAASTSDGSGYTNELISDLISQYNTKLSSDLTFNALAGLQIRHSETKNVNASGGGLVFPDNFNVSTRTGEPSVGEFTAVSRQVGVYADARIGYKNYLFLHGTLRNDWVSILEKENNSFMYPSVDASFVATDAIPALKDIKFLNNLKLRAGWSQVGQVNLGGYYGAYQLLPTYSQAYGFPYADGPGFTANNTLVAKGLKPEITTSVEAGFDATLWDNRASVSLTYFDSKTSNQTINTGVSSATGYSGLRTNVGLTSSKGLELNGSVDVYKNRNLTVTLGGNYTYLQNKVIEISENLNKLALNPLGNGSGSYAKQGYAFPIIMGYDYQRNDKGKVIVDEITGLPKKTDTISYLGDGVTKNTIGLNGSVKYKAFTFSVVAEYRGGGYIYNTMGGSLDWSGTGYRTAIYNRERFVFPNSVYWDATKNAYVDNKNITIKDGNGNTGFWTDGVNRDVSSNYVTSADFWKIREVKLSYELPKRLLAKSKFIKGVNLSLQGRNLFLFMAKDNYYTDPEFSTAGSDNNGIGVTGLSAPPSRHYGFTVSLDF